MTDERLKEIKEYILKMAMIGDALGGKTPSELVMLAELYDEVIKYRKAVSK